MTTFELELERDKAGKINEVAERGAALARELGYDAESVQTFLRHYFRHVDALDVAERSVDDLLGMVRSHYQLAENRPAARATIAIRTPSQSDDGWTCGGATVVQIVTDDRPFLVDSVTMEVLRQGWSIREVFHPQFLVDRDIHGALHGILTAEQAASGAPRRGTADQPTNVVAESWMHLEITPPSGQGHPERLTEALEQGLREVLQLVEDAVEDWAKMQQRAGETVALLTYGELPAGRRAEAEVSAELLRWLTDSHFTFLGYREYRYQPADPETGGEAGYVAVPATGLGILRGDADEASTFHALPRDDHPLLLAITKDSYKSRVHRPSYLDYLGIRLFDTAGNVIGERRFLGLFASTAYSESVTRIPLLRQKAREVLRRSQYDESSHGGKAVMDVLETFPRDELFQSPLVELAPTIEKVAHLKERRQVRLFVRRDPYGRYLSCIVYLPRDRYTTAVRNKMQEVLLSGLGGSSIDFTARVTESVLARLHFVVGMARGTAAGEVDVRALERELTQATRSWDDEFAELLADVHNPDLLAERVKGLPEGYKEDYTPRQGIKDLTAIIDLSGPEDMAMAMYRPDRADDDADLRFKIFRWSQTLSLSKIMPHLSLLGVDVVDERPYELVFGEHKRGFVYDFGVVVPGGRAAVEKRWDTAAREQFMEAFAASYSGRSEPDRFNALVMGADLGWRQVSLLRAIGRYLRQTGSTYSQTYVAQSLSANVEIARLLVELFETKFNPELELSKADRAEEVEDLRDKIKLALDSVASLDHDKIIRSYLGIIDAVIRTSFYQPGRDTVAFKLLPRKIVDLPQPRPAYEIFVYSPRVEGVHLRFGSVARGGLRWSDRAEDFRTEVLGLVKAQMVKNTVIVPVGAKGGFYCKHLPDPSVDREAWLKEGKACYQLFISSLLDITDNIVGGEVVPPKHVIRYDSDDPYLVVAADKGTASFSDIANAISLEYEFWLGDAFASGGSAGYDHKGMGITARGAWVSVQRHFRELGIDPQTHDFTCVGIGDMSGDVFGNGMLRSEHTKLVAAFDHRHVLIDPDPDPAASFAERKRLSELGRSSWGDYDTSLISAGGGVFPRSLKSIGITPQMRKALGIAESVVELSPAELISACLRAPVDLLWNGGIGTYVKATAESHAQVGDKANDGLRVNGSEVRARAVGEGGNLGLTQLGRIEYALRGGKSGKGGRINTDFIDNSAGVDTSDHEVNIKILLTGEVNAGRLTMPDRDALLASMTDEVAQLVLRHNYDQNLALANAVYQAPSMAGVHEDWMERLVERGVLDRAIEFLPTSEEMTERRREHRGLTSPELCTLMSYTKIMLARDVLSSDLPDDPDLADRLVNYFPTPLRERYDDQIRGHRLSREIITTVLVNDFVNKAGNTTLYRLSSETGAGVADLIRANVAARTVFSAPELELELEGLDFQIGADVQTELRLETRTLVERATRWLVNNRRRPIDISACVDFYAEPVAGLAGVLPELLTGRDADAYSKALKGYLAKGVPEKLARRVATQPYLFAALTIVPTAVQMQVDADGVASVHFSLGQRLGLDRLLARIIELPRTDRWEIMARAALRDDLHAVQAELTAEAMSIATAGSTKQRINLWEKETHGVPESIKTLRSICDGKPELAKTSVGLRVARGLLSRA